MFTKANREMPAIKKLVGKRDSKYNFAALDLGGHDIVDVIDAKRTAARLTSAVASYRKRSGDKRIFSVRTEVIDGRDVVSVWVLPAKAA